MITRFLLAAILVACSASVYARGYYFGYVQKGGNTVNLAGFISATKVQQSYPGAAVTVYLAGTVTKATLYSNATGTALANPFNSSTSDASFNFYTDTTLFDITFNGVGITTSCGATTPGYPCISAFTWSRQTFNGTQSSQSIYYVTDYGAVCDGVTDDATSIQAAVTAAQASSIGGIVQLPTTAGGNLCVVGTPIAINGLAILQGTSSVRSGLRVTGNTGAITVADGSNRVLIRDMRIIGPGASSTAVGILLTNTSNSLITNVKVTNFGVGIRFATGLNSCFDDSIQNSEILSNNTYSIDAQAATNNLHLLNVTFGGGPSTNGLRVMDSLDPHIFGGNCEGVSVTCIDLDGAATVPMGGTINGVHFEANTSSGGDIRIGNTSNVDTVSIYGNYWQGNAAGASAVNIVRGTNISIHDNEYRAPLYTTFINQGTVSGLIAFANGPIATTLTSTILNMGPVSLGQSTTAPAILDNGTITTSAVSSVARVAPAAARVGIILQAGTQPGQIATVINESIAASSITFAASGTSNVADGVASTIAGLTSRTFTWDSITALWYPSK